MENETYTGELTPEELEQVSGGKNLSWSGTAGKAKVVHCDCLRIRDAKHNGAILGLIPCGTVVDFYGWDSGWGKVKYTDKKGRSISGYSWGEYLVVLL